MQFIILCQEDHTYHIETADNALAALKQYVAYCYAGDNMPFIILCDSGKMTVTELITYANHYLLPNYAEIREIYILGELVAKS